MFIYKRQAEKEKIPTTPVVTQKPEIQDLEMFLKTKSSFSIATASE